MLYVFHTIIHNNKPDKKYIYILINYTIKILFYYSKYEH